jgi:hypothetical protein
MLQNKFVLCSATALLALAVACSKSTSPSAPGSTTAVIGEAAADGSTLKVTAPTPQSPVGGAQPTDLTFVSGVSTAQYAAAIPAGLSYQMEIKNAGGTTVCTANASASGTTVTFRPTCTLDFDANYTWRVRATASSTAVGPWSTAASFRSPSGGYIRVNEVFDPLTNGKTVGEIVGPVTFIPGVGVRLEDFSSHIRYRLPQTMVRGEFSIIITGMATNTEGDKTKVMAMSEGLDDIVTNDRRMTVEKRGDPEGIVAWRFISHEDQVDTEGAERQFVNFDPNQAYLFTATWNGVFGVRIQRGGASGPTIYNQAKAYRGAYDPDPHYAFIGSPSGRSGITAATVPGMIVRNVWISQNPRPAGIGQ